MAYSAAPLTLLLHLVCVAANRAPGVAPHFAAPGQSKTDLHLLAELESHWIACSLAVVLLVSVIEHRPEFIFGPSKVVASRGLFVPDQGRIAEMRTELAELQKNQVASRDIGGLQRDTDAMHAPSAGEAAVKPAEVDIAWWVEKGLTVATPIMRFLLQALIWLLIALSPFIRLIAVVVWHIFRLLPKNVLRMLYGLVLCFFGGTFVATIAAAEAFNALGGQKTIPDFQNVIMELYHAWEASSSDEPVGMIGKAGATMGRTARMMAVIRKPEELQTSVSACAAISMAVLSTLRFQFAKTSALAIGIANILKAPIVVLLEPAIKYCLGPAVGHWASTLIDIALKSVALSLAWYLQKFVSAFYSGIRGGTLFVYGMMRLLHLHGKQPSYLDEFLGYPLAAYGFYFQITHYFCLPYPWNVALLPLEMIEYGLEWAISYSS